MAINTQKEEKGKKGNGVWWFGAKICICYVSRLTPLDKLLISASEQTPKMMTNLADLRLLFATI